MHGVVSTLLDLSAVEAGRAELDPESVSVAALVEESCRPLALMAEQAGVAIAREVPDGLPPLIADRRACQQILMNLVSNAVKFTPPGGLVTVHARREAEGLVVLVRDTGVGVQPSELPRLCEPFYRAGSTRACGKAGTGLGLAVVQGLVALHRGRLSLASSPGEGLCATVTLPLDPGLCRRTGRVRPEAPARALPRRAQTGVTATG
jgi:cell cycle sensor histidine kinase DivJ